MRALLLTVLLLVPLALATHDPVGRCDGGGYPALGIVEFTGGSADKTFYVDDRNQVTGNGIWVYMEYNGVWSSHGGAGVFADDVTRHNLQRGGGHYLGIFPEDVPELCVDDWQTYPDALLL